MKRVLIRFSRSSAGRHPVTQLTALALILLTTATISGCAGQPVQQEPATH
jgi:hypothetical protein